MPITCRGDRTAGRRPRNGAGWFYHPGPRGPQAGSFEPWPSRAAGRSFICRPSRTGGRRPHILDLAPALKKIYISNTSNIEKSIKFQFSDSSLYFLCHGNANFANGFAQLLTDFSNSLFSTNAIFVLLVLSRHWLLGSCKMMFWTSRTILCLKLKWNFLLSYSLPNLSLSLEIRRLIVTKWQVFKAWVWGSKFLKLENLIHKKSRTPGSGRHLWEAWKNEWKKKEKKRKKKKRKKNTK